MGSSNWGHVLGTGYWAQHPSLSGFVFLSFSVYPNFGTAYLFYSLPLFLHLHVGGLNDNRASTQRYPKPSTNRDPCNVYSC